ncbi:hypothetical protein [Novosphingobium sp. PhB165]|uniref:hypothetical protein n=1 Tax=Novosphingobium sp. PhB165 TaxID=2485105 RepID=UPI0010525110|nr:hypothetical protein [Novosphingobium sp. PhB165]
MANPAQAQASNKDIVVKGQAGKEQDNPKSTWKRAEADHVVVFSTGSDDELKRVTRNLELLHRLMARLYLHGAEPGEVMKLQVVLMDSQDRMEALGLRDLRSQQGPFPAPFASRSYYDPRENGEVLVIPRSEQMIDLNTSRRFSSDCEDRGAQEDGGDGMCGNIPRHPPIARPWEGLLSAAFAQHFLLTYLPAAYPRWYLDGMGELFSTLDVKHSGEFDYAVPPEGFKDVFKSYGYPKVAEILTGHYLQDPDAAQGWNPYGAWLVTYYFVFSKPKPERYAQFEHYMADIRRGVPQADAAAVFGDMQALQREIQSCGNRDIAYAHAEAQQPPVAEPLVTALSPAAGALLEAKIEQDSRLATGGSTEGWLLRVRDMAAQFPGDADVQLFAAAAECRGGQTDECLAGAERVLAKAPDDAEALTWKGVALTDRAMAGAEADRLERLATARGALVRAIALDDQATEPRIAYFLSFTKAGQPVPQGAMRGMVEAIRRVPAAPGPRLALGRELVREGQAEMARQVLNPVLFGAYDSPERSAARNLLSLADGSATIRR